MVEESIDEILESISDAFFSFDNNLVFD